MVPDFKKDFMAGLRTKPKTISSMYFYDREGDKLFQEIMRMPEYYLTDAEHEIFSRQSAAMIRHLGLCPGQPFEVIELGAGDGTKTIMLLQAMLAQKLDLKYIPIDISHNALDLLTAKLRNQLPKLKVAPRQGDYFGVLHDLNKVATPKVILFVGSNIGNMDDVQSRKFIAQLSDRLNIGDKLLLGVDLIKEKHIVLPAYNDSSGITSSFNLNVLLRANRELHANFDTNNFEHIAEYNDHTGIAKSFLKSKVEQIVQIAGEDFHFAKNEMTQTEISRKFDQKLVAQLIAGSGLTEIAVLTDSQGLFCDYIFSKTDM